MKIIYSELKKILPELPVDPKTLRDDLTMIGHFVSGFEETAGEYILDLEIRQNRADCLGYYGLARDLSVLYNIKLNIDTTPLKSNSQYQLPIVVKSPLEVLRLQAIKISNLKNSNSPEWLVKFLRLHDINSINTLVDLTNYVMLIWGIPNHAFDIAKSSEKLTWELLSKPQKFITLAGSTLNLDTNTLAITSNNVTQSLTFIGGQNCAIDLTTTDIIIENAVYNATRVRQNSRYLKTITEASIRLDKFLDTETIPLALNYLISLILNLCGGQISSSLYDYYPEKSLAPTIHFNPTKPTLYAGVEISTDFALNCLTRLGCQSTIYDQKSKIYAVIPPSIRKDINIEEDLIEEVIRFYGYDKIPVNQTISSEKLPDITPKILYLIEKIKDELISQGYDEVRSWPLVKKPLSDNAVYTQNSINSEYPVLRESIIQSLEHQLNQYKRYKLPNPKFFEIGKIFYLENGQYIEKYALGIYDGSKFSETILNDLDKPNSYIPKNTNSLAIELTSQIITLDANVTFDSPQNPQELIDKYTSLIDPKILWSIEILDSYQNKYTFRVSYYNCDDKTAKKIHLSVFNLD